MKSTIFLKVEGTSQPNPTKEHWLQQMVLHLVDRVFSLIWIWLHLMKPNWTNSLSKWINWNLECNSRVIVQFTPWLTTCDQSAVSWHYKQRVLHCFRMRDLFNAIVPTPSEICPRERPTAESTEQTHTQSLHLRVWAPHSVQLGQSGLK